MMILQQIYYYNKNCCKNSIFTVFSIYVNQQFMGILEIFNKFDLNEIHAKMEL